MDEQPAQLTPQPQQPNDSNLQNLTPQQPAVMPSAPPDQLANPQKAMSPKGHKKIAGIMLLIFSIFFLGMGLLIHTVTKVPSSDISTTGTVVSVTKTAVGGIHPGISYCETVKFNTKDGSSITFASNTCSTTAPAVGASVKVSYSPNDPQNTAKNSASSKTFDLIGEGLMVVGFVMIIGGVTLLVKA